MPRDQAWNEALEYGRTCARMRRPVRFGVERWGAGWAVFRFEQQAPETAKAPV